MNCKTFLDIITRLKTHSQRTHDCYKLGLDLCNFDEDLFVVISSLFKEIYGTEGLEWIEWFCYEHVGEHFAQDADGNRICDTPENLWKYLEEHHRQLWEVQK